MVVDLKYFPFQQVLPIIKWCLAHDIDRARCLEMLYQWHNKNSGELDWTLTISSKYSTMFILKFVDSSYIANTVDKEKLNGS